jgi:hypothetical protein
MKLFLTLFLTSFTALFGQKLNFDVMAQYSCTYDNSTNDRIAYAITTNDNYFMRILNYPEGLQVANVYDIKALKEHVYIFTESMDENGVKKYKFTHTRSLRFVRSPGRTIYFDFTNVSNIDNFEMVKLNFYKNKSKTKISDSLELKIIKSELNLFRLYRFICLHPKEFITELNYSGGGLVTKCVSNNGTITDTLKAFGEVNFEVTIPDTADLKTVPRHPESIDITTYQ